eukprot:scaffold7275_cov61-Phaeocystis_antarctica.AAC.6
MRAPCERQVLRVAPVVLPPCEPERKLEVGPVGDCDEAAVQHGAARLARESRLPPEPALEQEQLQRHHERGDAEQQRALQGGNRAQPRVPRWRRAAHKLAASGVARQLCAIVGPLYGRLVGLDLRAPRAGVGHEGAPPQLVPARGDEDE